MSFQRIRLTVLLFTINVTLIVIFCLSWIRNPYLVLNFHRSEKRVMKDEYVIDGLPPRAQLGEYMKSMSGRTVFRFGQQEEKPVEKRRMIDDLEYIGSSRTPGGYRAFLRNSVSRETYTVTTGDRLGEYEVVEINPHSIILGKDDEKFELKR